MESLIRQLREAYDAKPCHCQRCDQPLPILHSADHLCDKCREVIVSEDVAFLRQLLEVLHGDEEAK